MLPNNTVNIKAYPIIIKAYSINFGPQRPWAHGVPRLNPDFNLLLRSPLSATMWYKCTKPTKLVIARVRSVHFSPEAIAFTTLVTVGVPVARYYGHRRVAVGLGIMGVVGAGYFIARPPTSFGSGNFHGAIVRRTAEQSVQTPPGQSSMLSYVDTSVNSFINVIENIHGEVAPWMPCVDITWLI